MYRPVSWSAAIGCGASSGWVGRRRVGHRPADRSSPSRTSAQALLVLAGGLRLDGVRRPIGVAMRRGFDGLMLASCGAYTMWTLVIGPARLSFLGRPVPRSRQDCGTAVARAERHRHRHLRHRRLAHRRRGPVPLLAAIAFGATAGRALWVAAGYGDVPASVYRRSAQPPSHMELAVGAIAGQVRRRGVRIADRPRTPDQGGTLLAWVPVSIAIVACMVHLADLSQRRQHEHRHRGRDRCVSERPADVRDARHPGLRRRAEPVARPGSEQLALTDPLTNLSNRRAFAQTLEQRVAGGPPSVAALHRPRRLQEHQRPARATTSVTRCSSRSPAGCAPTSGPATSRPVSAATSSRSCCGRRTRRRWPPRAGCARCSPPRTTSPAVRSSSPRASVSRRATAPPTSPT